MPIKTKTLNFKGNSITFLFHQAFGWCAPAKLIGLALGYANGGQKLNDHITNSWSKKGWKDSDYKVFSGKELKEMKVETPEYGVSSEANSVLFLSMTGVVRVLFRSRSKTADEFRNFLSSKGGELTEGLSIPKKTSFKSHKKTEVLTPSNDIPTHLRTRLALLAEMKKYNFGDEHIQKLLMDLYTQETNRQNTSAALSTIGALTAGSKKDATQLVPVSNAQLSTMTPNFDQIRSFFLTGHQKHPKYQDWISAEEIGAPIGMKADLVKKYSTQYLKERGYDLSNNVARKKVVDAGGWIRGAGTLLDDTCLPCYVNETVGCLAVWYMTEEAQTVWRNYWSPAAVTEILKLIPDNKKLVPGNGAQAVMQSLEEPIVVDGETVEGQASAITPTKQ